MHYMKIVSSLIFLTVLLSHAGAASPGYVPDFHESYTTGSVASAFMGEQQISALREFLTARR